jgi:ATP-binding cassette subfamily G (WHITE) protein 2 (SNQ2)
MYRLSPHTYLIEGLLGQALGEQDINCSAVELVSINPPSGMSCAEYMNPFISRAGGYLTNPEATSACQFCSTRTTDQFLEASFNIFYSHRWRNVGIMLAFIGFNVSWFLFFFVVLDADGFRRDTGVCYLRPDLPIPHTDG